MSAATGPAGPGPEYWRRALAGYRASAKARYAEARLCEQWAEDTKDEHWRAIYRTWAEQHREGARWARRMSHETMAHIKKLWPEAAAGDSTKQSAGR